MLKYRKFIIPQLLIVVSICYLATIALVHSQNLSAKPITSEKKSTGTSKKLNAVAFSGLLDAYPVHSTTKALTVEEILANTSTAGVTLSSTDTSTRKAAIQMYKDFGVDISLDNKNQRSKQLENLAPKHWSSQTPQPLSGNFVQPFSIDAPFYHAIASNSPRVALPAAYIKGFQLNTIKGGDGIGLPVIISSSSDPSRRVRSEWYGNTATRVDYYDNVRNDWQNFRGATTYGDKTAVFINSNNKTQLNAYSVNLDPNGADILSNYAAGIYPLGTLGDKGGTTASGVSNLAALIRPGEATNPSSPIPHATMGPVRRPWKARVYPAISWDQFIDGADPCTGSGLVNTGLVPYGGIIQLDPSLKFTAVGDTTNYQTTVNGQSLTISLPAFRILQAMQTYGHYVVDYGCADLDVYTNTDDSEYANYGGSYTVQSQIQSVLTKANLYIVPPLVKK
jgi:hypothetical protein